MQPPQESARLASQTISGAGSGNAIQSYQYDRLNRIQSAGEGSGSAWSRGFDYDRYGNGWVTSGANISSFTPQASGSYDGSNHLNILGAVYDEAGNQKQAGSYVFA